MVCFDLLQFYAEALSMGPDAEEQVKVVHVGKLTGMGGTKGCANHGDGRLAIYVNGTNTTLVGYALNGKDFRTKDILFTWNPGCGCNLKGALHAGGGHVGTSPAQWRNLNIGR